MTKWFLIVIGLVAGIIFAHWAMSQTNDSLPWVCLLLMAPLKGLSAVVLQIIPLDRVGFLVRMTLMYPYWALLGALFGLLLYQCSQLLMSTIKKSEAM